MMRNERSYNSSLGPTRVGAIQTPVRARPKPARVNRLGPVRCKRPALEPLGQGFFPSFTHKRYPEYKKSLKSGAFPCLEERLACALGRAP